VSSGTLNLDWIKRQFTFKATTLSNLVRHCPVLRFQSPRAESPESGILKSITPRRRNDDRSRCDRRVGGIYTCVIPGRSNYLELFLPDSVRLSDIVTVLTLSSVALKYTFSSNILPHSRKFRRCPIYVINGALLSFIYLSSIVRYLYWDQFRIFYADRFQKENSKATVWCLSVPHDVIPKNSRRQQTARLQSCHWLVNQAILADRRGQHTFLSTDLLIARCVCLSVDWMTEDRIS